ncbi:hypothetical protein BDV39DRAFT_214584 [Aspergillus sergii]|uniref:Uncharacterized protein n=1 Tax=Aspergillus sergii TaxID=1034303 RepID=A0A5N6X459_9EURO|nr:hypothetical protein BDV39DRAFT_214584 [Aspergillus sergii]
MDYAILELFTSLVISTAPIDNQSTTHDESGELSDSDIIFGLSDGLLDIIKRISSLHFRSRTKKVNNSTTITEAVGIWQDLATWQPPEALPGEQYQELYDSYTSALFTWLYLILHPDSMCDAKVQSMVEQGVVTMSAVTVLELSPFLLIPLFILGLASVQDEHKDFISGRWKYIARWWSAVGKTKIRECREAGNGSSGKTRAPPGDADQVEGQRESPTKE